MSSSWRYDVTAVEDALNDRQQCDPSQADVWRHLSAHTLPYSSSHELDNHWGHSIHTHLLNLFTIRDAYRDPIERKRPLVLLIMQQKCSKLFLYQTYSVDASCNDCHESVKNVLK